MLTVTMILEVKSFLVDVYLDFKEMDMEAVTEHQACKLTKKIHAYVNNWSFFLQEVKIVDNHKIAILMLLVTMIVRKVVMPAYAIKDMLVMVLYVDLYMMVSFKVT